MGTRERSSALYRGFDALRRNARSASGCDNSCLALHEILEGSRHRINAFLRYNNGAVPIGMDEIAAPYPHAVNGDG